MQEELRRKSEQWEWELMLKYLDQLESHRVIRKTAEANLKELEAKVAEVEETEKNCEDVMLEDQDAQQGTLPEDINKELLDHLEKVSDDYLQNVDKIPTGEKLVRAREEELQAVVGLEPWEINEIVQQALNNLPEGLEEHVGSLFDVLYEAVAEGISRTQTVSSTETL